MGAPANWAGWRELGGIAARSGSRGASGHESTGGKDAAVTGLWFGGACPSTVWHFGNLIDLPEPHAASLPLQTEIAKRLNTILAQIMPFLSQEVRRPLARSSGPCRAGLAIRWARATAQGFSQPPLAHVLIDKGRRVPHPPCPVWLVALVCLPLGLWPSYRTVALL